VSIREVFGDICSAGGTLQRICHGASSRAGWWDDDTPPTFLVPLKIALIHSELSEALEAHRKDVMDDKLPHRPGLEVELADALIRIFDLAGRFKLDLGGAMAEKLTFNEDRLDHKPEARAAAGGKRY
jgi:NTP pyrophosphatase (non-canonical NTP hydrolase)